MKKVNCNLCKAEDYIFLFRLDKFKVPLEIVKCRRCGLIFQNPRPENDVIESYYSKGYYTGEANLVGLESRTSSPVRIPRDKETLQHPQIGNLFPCGEGAGYAGGIISAGIDGEKCAEAVAQLLDN